MAELVASGEVTGKAFETVLLHRPQGLKAKRLLVVGAGKAKSFTHAEVRKAAGSAIRALEAQGNQELRLFGARSRQRRGRRRAHDS